MIGLGKKQFLLDLHSLMHGNAFLAADQLEWIGNRLEFTADGNQVVAHGLRFQIKQGQQVGVSADLTRFDFCGDSHRFWVPSIRRVVDETRYLAFCERPHSL